MAQGPITQIQDVIVPEIFNSYTQQLTEEKSRLIATGAIVRSPQLDDNLSGGGLTFNVPSFKDLDNDEDNVSGDEPDDSFVTDGNSNSTPKKTGTSNEVAVRLSRNQSWSTADLASELAGADAGESIANLVSDYWARRLQAAFVATMNGVFNNNAAAPTAAQHVQNDLTNDVSGDTYSAGVTDFNASAFIDAAVTMGDSMGNLSMLCVHSIVYARMQKNNLIEFIPDSRGEAQIPTFLGREVIVDDGLPTPSSGVFHSWLFGNRACLLGMGAPMTPTETFRSPNAGNGGGQSTLYNRVQWAIHPVGHSFDATPNSGGPGNSATTNNLAHAASWQRVYAERKQIPMARLITREF